MEEPCSTVDAVCTGSGIPGALKLGETMNSENPWWVIVDPLLKGAIVFETRAATDDAAYARFLEKQYTLRRDMYVVRRATPEEVKQLERRGRGPQGSKGPRDCEDYRRWARRNQEAWLNSNHGPQA